MTISKAAVISLLRERGQHARADFVDRELPERIDVSRHGGLLATLRLDPTDVAEPESGAPDRPGRRPDDG